MTVPAAARLEGLRRRLTIAVVVLTAAGSIGLGWLLVDRDARHRNEVLDGQLSRTTWTVKRLLQYDTALITRYVSGDEINTQCPQFTILPGGGEPFAAHVSARTCVPVDRARLDQLAGWAVDSGNVLNTDLRGTGGELVRVSADPFRNTSGQYIGAVVAVLDARPSRADHRQLVLLVVAAGLVQVAVAGTLTNLLCRRAIRPGVTALEQQEVLLADTAHDLRTPVAALRALAETALGNPTRSADLLPRTVALAARMGGVIDALLVRARLAAGVEQLDIQPVWLDQLVSTVVEETPTDGAQVTVTAAPSKVNVDVGLVQRAIGNLLDNALRHGRRPGEAVAVVHITVAGGRVMVADHGPGIDPALAPGSFDRFSSGPGSTGLGLPIVRWVAQAHGGMLRVYNAESGGAIFELVLPDGGS
ncbi:HAMP domain-containing sensor histidine kinase [Solwaraspora sp. WMMD1047]|uniref:sensor histidine kinase n=1 Tax=Solwaraspora sp. WMMD1047 TaxID=3016102 RepID=UPI002416514B|nr:HAMP domain-containing sensor histidine kinase [Solwaraspora sp. WMMD1047]MDG4831860.1 HAMP domain-containing sensor histidine kinase [Solwaraspora sp. WMMD1047]